MPRVQQLLMYIRARIYFDFGSLVDTCSSLVGSVVHLLVLVSVGITALLLLSDYSSYMTFELSIVHHPTVTAETVDRSDVMRLRAACVLVLATAGLAHRANGLRAYGHAYSRPNDFTPEE
jgi:hypothetical protein